MLNLFQKLKTVATFAYNAKQLQSDDESVRKHAYDRIEALAGDERGILLKISQFIASNETSTENLRQLSLAKRQCISFDSFYSALSIAINKNPNEVFKIISKEGKAASLSQVHSAEFMNGKKVAIKLLLPDIRKATNEILNLINFIPKAGPAKKFSMPIEEYKIELNHFLNTEMDLKSEAAHFAQLKQDLIRFSFIEIPQIYNEYSNKDVLIMSWMDGIAFDDFCVTASMAQKKKAAENLLKVYLTQVLIKNHYQTDMNPGNFLFATDKIQLIDAGSYAYISNTWSDAIIELIDASKNSQATNLVEIYTDLGFDAEKLKFIEDQLALLTRTVLEPFLTNQPFDCRSWSVSQRAETILGSKKWWFRSSGSPQFFHLVRSFYMLTQLISQLNVNINWYEIYNEVRSHANTPFKIRKPDEKSFQNLAKNLKIQISDALNGEELVNLEMPVHTLDNIEEYISDEVLNEIKSENIDLDKIKKDFYHLGGRKMQLFKVTKNNKNYVVSVE